MTSPVADVSPSARAFCTFLGDIGSAGPSRGGGAWWILGNERHLKLFFPERPWDFPLGSSPTWLWAPPAQGFSCGWLWGPLPPLGARYRRTCDRPVRRSSSRHPNLPRPGHRSLRPVMKVTEIGLAVAGPVKPSRSVRALASPPRPFGCAARILGLRPAQMRSGTVRNGTPDGVMVQAGGGVHHGFARPLPAEGG